MQRSVLTHLALDVTEPATLVLEIAVAQAYLDAGVASESLVFAGEDGPLAPTELVTPHGTRVHVLEAPAGSLSIDYSATIDGRIAPRAGRALGPAAVPAPLAILRVGRPRPDRAGGVLRGAA